MSRSARKRLLEKILAARQKAGGDPQQEPVDDETRLRNELLCLFGPLR